MNAGTEKQRIKAELNIIRRKINRDITTNHNKSVSKHLNSYAKGAKKLWKVVKKARGKSDSHLNKIKINNVHSIDDNDKANCLAKIFEKSHHTTASFTHENDPTVTNTITSFTRFNNFQCPHPQIDRNEIEHMLKSLKPFKSPGPDSIQNILLIRLPASGINFITKLINKCIEKSHWTENFKLAKVIPIVKAGKPASDPNSYRPISLLNTIGKIMEKVVYNRLVEVVDRTNLLPKIQFGFRKGHSTVHQVKRIQNYITRNKIIKNSTGVVLLDIAKAFDSIWHDGLIYKLIKMKIPTFLIRMLNAFIRNRYFEVHINNSISNKIHIPAGLAQGTSISPILYSLYVADIPTNQNTQLALYADDLFIFI